MARKQVALYLDEKVMKRIKHESVDRNCSIGSLVEEALVSWVKGYKQLEMENRKKQMAAREKEKLQMEIEELQETLNGILKERSEGKHKGRMKGEYCEDK